MSSATIAVATVVPTVAAPPFVKKLPVMPVVLSYRRTSALADAGLKAATAQPRRRNLVRRLCLIDVFLRIVGGRVARLDEYVKRAELN
jgi:hypothetical protein